MSLSLLNKKYFINLNWFVWSEVKQNYWKLLFDLYKFRFSYDLDPTISYEELPKSNDSSYPWKTFIVATHFEKVSGWSSQTI